MTTATSVDEFERVVVRRGARSGLPIIVAVHSTALGQAIGGCRLARYPSWRAGLDDALRLSAAMTDKCAVAGLPNGGGKTVVALPPHTTLDAAGGGAVLHSSRVAFDAADRGAAFFDAAGRSAALDLSRAPFDAVAILHQPRAALDVIDRRAILHDVADAIDSLGGEYATGPDVGTSPDDMAVIGERTRHVFCRPPAAGGSGDSSLPTALGVLAALAALGAPGTRRRIAIMGLGRVGEHLARALAADGADLIVSDIDESRRELAGSLGAAWVTPDEILEAEADVLVPAALGGILTRESVPRLRCAVIAGPANNQLDEPATADLLRDRGILWAPDFVVGAGGVIHATAVELHGETVARAEARVRGIGGTLTEVLEQARHAGSTPLAAARELARTRVAAAASRAREGCVCPAWRGLV